MRLTLRLAAAFDRRVFKRDMPAILKGRGMEA